MKRHVGDFIRRCLTCQQVKAEHQKPTGLLQPLKVAEWKWEHVTMDFVTHLPRTPQGMSTTFHPQTDGQSERTIQVLEDMLQACVLDHKGSGEVHLPLVEFT